MSEHGRQRGPLWLMLGVIVLWCACCGGCGVQLQPKGQVVTGVGVGQQSIQRHVR